jgi:hypothetical protein
MQRRALRTQPILFRRLCSDVLVATTPIDAKMLNKQEQIGKGRIKTP